jgi:cytochrome c5
MRGRTVLGVLCVIVAFGIAGCMDKSGTEPPESAAPPAAPAEAPAAEETAAEEAAPEMAAAEILFKDACTSCHKLDRVERHAKEKLAAEPWEEVVTRMVEENGAKISPEDQKTIVSYLEAKYKN